MNFFERLISLITNTSVINPFKSKGESFIKCKNCGNDTFNEGAGGGSFGNIECTKCKKKYNNLGPFGLQEIN